MPPVFARCAAATLGCVCNPLFTRIPHTHTTHHGPQGTTRRLIAHCGLPWHPNLLRFYETERAVQTASQLQVLL